MRALCGNLAHSSLSIENPALSFFLSVPFLFSFSLHFSVRGSLPTHTDGLATESPSLLLAFLDDGSPTTPPMIYLLPFLSCLPPLPTQLLRSCVIANARRQREPKEAHVQLSPLFLLDTFFFDVGGQIHFNHTDQGARQRRWPWVVCVVHAARQQAAAQNLIRLSAVLSSS